MCDITGLAKLSLSVSLQAALVCVFSLVLAGAAYADQDKGKPPPGDELIKEIDNHIAALRDPQADAENAVQTTRAKYYLKKIGKPAVERVREKWPQLDELHKWRLMDFRSEFDYEASLEFVLASLDSKLADVRLNAIEYLRLHKEAKGRAKLLKMLNVEVPEQHRWRIVDALGYMGDDAVATALIALLEKNSWAAKGDGWQWEGFAAGVPTYPDCRHRIVTVLGQIDAKKAAPRLLELLKEKGSGKANWGYEIMPLLAKWGYKEAIPELKAVLASKEEDAPVFSAAVCLLELKDRTGMPLLEAELKNPAGAHESVCQVLAQFGSGLDQNLVPLLVGLLDDNANDELVMVRSVAACRALAKITGIQLRPGQTEAGLEDVPLWKAWYEKNKKSKGK